MASYSRSSGQDRQRPRDSVYEERISDRGPPLRRGPPPPRGDVDNYRRSEVRESRGIPRDDMDRYDIREERRGPRDEVDTYERRETFREERERAPLRREPAPVRDFDDRESLDSRVPAFMRDERQRAPEAGALVLRAREVETVRRRSRSRSRSRSPSVHVRERERVVQRERGRGRSPSDSPVRRERVEIHDRVVERETDGPPRRVMGRPRGRSPSVERERVEIRDRVVERETDGPPRRMMGRPRGRSPSVERTRTTTRVVETERERGRSPSPVMERERLRVMERSRSRLPSRSPSPPRIRGETIEREVITHYHDIDHGMTVARPLTPPPAPRTRGKEREIDIDIREGRHHTDIDIREGRHRTDIDIHEGRHHTDVDVDIRDGRHHTDIDIHKGRHHTDIDIDIHEHTHPRGRTPSRERPSPRPLPPPIHHHHPPHAYDDEVIVRAERDRNRLTVEVDERRTGAHRRAHSAAPPVTPLIDPSSSSSDDETEADYLTRRIESRGRMGEARHGATRDWAIVDVPPGTERVRMDGVGGGGAEVTWQRYNGVRRARFIPERDGVLVPVAAPAPVPSSAVGVSDRELVRVAPGERERVSVSVNERGRDTEVDIEMTKDRRIALRPTAPPPTKRAEMWTEITKDLVIREAIEDFGYEYEETEFFFYVMQYLRYEDVLELVRRTDEIRHHRKDRLREIQWERDHRHRHRGRDWEHRHRYRCVGDEHIVEREREREVFIDRPPRGYLR